MYTEPFYLKMHHVLFLAVKNELFSQSSFIPVWY